LKVLSIAMFLFLSVGLAEASICTEEILEINQSVKEFELLQQKKDVAAVLNLFTWPINTEGNTFVSYKLNQFGEYETEYHLYDKPGVRFNLLSFEILTTEDAPAGQCLVNVREVRRYAVEDQGVEDEVIHTQLLLAKQTDALRPQETWRNGQWKIEKYLAKSDSRDKRKFSGWGL